MASKKYEASKKSPNAYKATVRPIVSGSTKQVRASSLPKSVQDELRKGNKVKF